MITTPVMDMSLDMIAICMITYAKARAGRLAQTIVTASLEFALITHVKKVMKEISAYQTRTVSQIFADTTTQPTYTPASQILNELNLSRDRIGGSSAVVVAEYSIDKDDNSSYSIEITR